MGPPFSRSVAYDQKEASFLSSWQTQLPLWSRERGPCHCRYCLLLRQLTSSLPSLCSATFVRRRLSFLLFCSAVYFYLRSGAWPAVTAFYGLRIVFFFWVNTSTNLHLFSFWFSKFGWKFDEWVDDVTKLCFFGLFNVSRRLMRSS